MTQYNRLKEISVSNGNGNFILGGTYSGFFTLSSMLAIDESFDYCIQNIVLGEVEIGSGHLSDSTTLVRDTVYKSTNSNNKVVFSAGNKEVFATLTAEYLNENVTPRFLSLTFGYGDATPEVIGTMPANELIQTVEIFITTAFDGVGAALVVGDAADSDRLMVSGQNDPTTVGNYESRPIYSYGSNTILKLGITPGYGATTGSGLVVITY